MKLELFQIIQHFHHCYQHLKLKQKIEHEHILFKKINNLLKTRTYSTIGFIHVYADDIQPWAIIDELIKKNKIVAISEFVNKELKFNKIDDIYKPFNFQDGYQQYKIKNYLIDNRPQILVVPLCAYKNKLGLVYEPILMNYLKNNEIVKVGYVLSENVIDTDKFDDELIPFDRIITI